MAEHKRETKDKESVHPLPFDPVEAALRQIFDDVASEDIPPDFADLIAKLEEGMRQPEEK
jgi:hypothetical protein